MPRATRIFDPVFCQDDVHGVWPWAIHFSVVGFFTSGSSNTFINNLAAVRLGDGGPHVACSGPNTFEATGGASKTYINDRKAIREGDETTHCGNPLSKGTVTPGMGSLNTYIED